MSYVGYTPAGMMEDAECGRWLICMAMGSSIRPATPTPRERRDDESESRHDASTEIVTS